MQKRYSILNNENFPHLIIWINKMLEMLSNVPTNAEKHVTSDIAYVHL